jgi:vacuolar-type H+-ATPase subunit I/STV1
MDKKELISALVKSGMTETDAAAALQSQVSTDADLMRKIHMQDAEIENYKNKVKQATDLFNRVNQERDAAEQAEKQRLIKEISIDSAWTVDQLTAKDLKTLQEINTTLKLNNNKTFASVAADIAELEKKKAPLFTVGAWDSKTQTYKGGITV